MLQLAEGPAQDHNVNQKARPWQTARPQKRKESGCLVRAGPWLPKQEVCEQRGARGTSGFRVVGAGGEGGWGAALFSLKEES